MGMKFQLLGIAFLVFQVSGMSRQEAVRAPYKEEEQVAEASEPQGFFEDINFQSFFEDVGLQGSESSPSKTELRQAPSSRAYFRPAPVKETNEGFIPENPFADFETAASNSHFTVIDSEKDFFAQESSPFGDFYGFGDDRSPFAASDNHREYLSPYAASHTNQRRVNFEDYGPPKGFFDNDFLIDFGSNNDDKKRGSKATQETRNEPKYDGAETKKQDEKTKKCQQVNKDGMTCEICKDDFGGFSEHCSHSLHSGKDQKFANSRRDAHDEIYDPLNLHRNPQEKQEESRKASNNDFAYNSDDQETTKDNDPTENYKDPEPTEKQELQEQQDVQQHQQQKLSKPTTVTTPPPTTTTTTTTSSTTTATSTTTEKSELPSASKGENVVEVAVFARKSPSGNRNRYSQSRPRNIYQARDDSLDKQYERANLYHPFADQSENNPYKSDKSDAVDKLIDTGLKDVIKRREKVLSSLPAEKSGKEEKDEEDVASQASQNKRQQQRQRGATHYKPIDPNENFKILGSMVKKFAKKDRSKCKKKQTKDGMTCYVCPNKHGQVDEECMYEKADPKKGGVHMMYKEEVTY